MPISAAIFDCDGLLMDTEPLWRDAEIDVFGQVGLQLTDDMTRETMGLRIDGVVGYWWDRAPWRGPSVEEIAIKVVEGVKSRILSQGELMFGVREIIKTFKELGFPMAVASSSPMELIEAVLKRGGLESALPLRYSAVDEAYGKPHPAVYLAAAEGLGISPLKCVALEDSITGILSAKSAQMRCIAVPDPSLRGDPRLAIADHVMETLKEASPQWCRRHLLGL